MDQRHERLRELSARLRALHGALLVHERRAYDETHGPTTAAELLRLLIHDEQFAWLRSLSSMIARIDEALDADGETAELDAERYLGEVSALLRSGGDGAFETKYHDALQRAPDVVIAHAEVMKVVSANRR